MSQLNREAILSKLSRMVDRLDNLKRFEAVSLSAYLEDDDRQLIVERRSNCSFNLPWILIKPSSSESRAPQRQKLSRLP